MKCSKIQASLENETKSKAEVMRLRKKLEADINDLETSLDQANLSNSDAQRNIRKYQDQLRELQVQLEDEQRQREDARELYSNSEKKCSALQSEKEEISVAIDAVSSTGKRHLNVYIAINGIFSANE